jgi:hypothetical protein
MPDKPEPALPEPIPAERGQDPPGTDTSTDWDEWMEKHGGPPQPLPDVAGEDGTITTPRRS